MIDDLGKEQRHGDKQSVIAASYSSSMPVNL